MKLVFKFTGKLFRNHFQNCIGLYVGASKFFLLSILLCTLSVLFLVSTSSKALAQSSIPQGIPQGRLLLKVLFWKAQCPAVESNNVETCEVAKAHDSQTPIEIVLEIPEILEAGTSKKSLEVRIDAKNPQEMSFQASLFSVFPFANTGYPPYLHLKIEIIHPVRAICRQNIRWQSPFEMATLICSGFQGEKNAPHVEMGITLIHIPELKPAE